MLPVASAVDWAIHNCLVLCESMEPNRVEQSCYWWSRELEARHPDTSLAYSDLTCGVGRVQGATGAGQVLDGWAGIRPLYTQSISQLKGLGKKSSSLLCGSPNLSWSKDVTRYWFEHLPAIHHGQDPQPIR